MRNPKYPVISNVKAFKQDKVLILQATIASPVSGPSFLVTINGFGATPDAARKHLEFSFEYLLKALRECALDIECEKCE